jgi:hypothetical protein
LRQSGFRLGQGQASFALPASLQALLAILGCAIDYASSYLALCSTLICSRFLLTSHSCARFALHSGPNAYFPEKTALVSFSPDVGLAKRMPKSDQAGELIVIDAQTVGFERALNKV